MAEDDAAALRDRREAARARARREDFEGEAERAGVARRGREEEDGTERMKWYRTSERVTTPRGRRASSMATSREAPVAANVSMAVASVSSG
jgi:hypothetical protein